MPRTDIHRPSAIQPDDYDFVACDYFGQHGGQMMANERKAFRNHMARTGGTFNQSHSGGTCHICGAAAMFVARYHHRPSNAYIVTGMDCAAKMDMGGEHAFKSFRKKVQKGMRAEKAARTGKAKAEALLAGHGLTRAWEIYTGKGDVGREETILLDMVFKMVKYGDWSEKQVAFARKLLADIAERPARQAAQAAKAAASNHIGTLGDRCEFELTIRACPSFDSQFGTVYINIMNDAAGNVVIYKGGKELGGKGDKVKLVATVKDHGEREGVKQTIIARPKVLENVA